MADEQLFYSPDIPRPPNLDEDEQIAVMQEAAKKRGGLRDGEDLTALPAGSTPPIGNWKSAGTTVAPASGTTYDLYTRDPDPSWTTPATPSSAPPAGLDALKDIDSNFSPAPPTDTVTKCAESFAEGFVEGFVVGYAVGFVLAALGPVGAVIGVGLLLYSAYQVVTNWDRIKAAPPEEKARMVGGLAGGIIGGGLGARAGGQFRETLTESPGQGGRPYSDLADPEGVEPGKDFTPAQKAKIIEANKARNGGVVRSDQSGEELVAPKKSTKGVTPPENEWQIDHITPKDQGGDNSYSNAQVLSRQENRAKWNK